MVTTFVRSAGDRTREVPEYVCHKYTGMKWAELVHPSLDRSLKLRFNVDVGGITRDNRVTTELGTGSLRQAVGILTPKDFRPIVASE